MRVTLIVAMDENGLIGANDGMPWHLPDDLRQFRKRTLHKPILMGRRTFEAIGRPLEKRDNLVLTRDDRFAADGVQRVAGVGAALDWAHDHGARELAVIGGAQVYALTLPRADRIYLTRVHDAFSGDTWFPPIDWNEWVEEHRERHPADDKHAQAYSFIELRRRD